MTRTLRGLTEAKATLWDGSVDEGRRPEERRRLETAVVPAVNGADSTVGYHCGGESVVCGPWG